MRIPTERFGEIEAPEEEIFRCPAGLPGFARLKRYVIVEHRPGSPLRWLQSIEDPAIAFVLIDPSLIIEQYAPSFRPSDLSVVEAREGDELIMAVILTIKGEPVSISANLKAPIIFNPRNNLCTQVVLEAKDGNYPLRYPVPTQAPAIAADTGASQESAAPEADNSDDEGAGGGSSAPQRVRQRAGADSARASAGMAATGT